MSAENPTPTQALREQVFSSLERISGTRLEDLSKMAKSVKNSIRTGELSVIETGGFQPWQTAFRLRVPNKNHDLPKGVIVVDNSRNYNTKTFDADLVRTVAVAYQYPENGFEKRLLNVYGDAMRLQAGWLLTNHINFALNDPRLPEVDGKNPIERVVKNLLGHGVFYSDFDMSSDWRKAVEQVWAEIYDEQRFDWEDQLDFLHSIQFDKSTFYRARQKLFDRMATSKELSGEFEKKLGQITPEERARYAARSAVRMLLMEFEEGQ